MMFVLMVLASYWRNKHANEKLVHLQKQAKQKLAKQKLAKQTQANNNQTNQHKTDETKLYREEAEEGGGEGRSGEEGGATARKENG